MCLVNFHYDEHPNYKLIVAANRDEFYDRPTAPADFWEDHLELVAGRDLLHLGTWLGVTKSGRFAALTNYRDPAEFGVKKQSRGDIVKEFLVGEHSPVEFLERLQVKKDDYAGFNVIVGDADTLFYYSNKQDEIKKIAAGTYSLSNHYLNTPWPKVTKGKSRLRDYVVQHETIETDRLFNLLNDGEVASDELLPDTGVGIELERQLSPLFIKTPNYGTRSSTVLLIDRQQNIIFVERTYVKGELTEENKFFLSKEVAHLE